MHVGLFNTDNLFAANSIKFGGNDELYKLFIKFVVFDDKVLKLSRIYSNIFKYESHVWAY